MGQTVSPKGVCAVPRMRAIIRTSVLGIAVNLGLAALKAVVGFLSASIAVTMDALNNLSDALSSAVTVAGILLAGRAPDKEHPYGHGRVEYVSALAVAVLILLAGVSSLWESLQKILAPAPAHYTPAMMALLGVGVAAKLLLGRHVRQKGRELHSDSLRASGTDALFDAAITSATLAGAFASWRFGISIEGFLGAAISVIILRAGLGILLESYNNIIGVRADAAFTNDIKQTVCAYPEVLGAYDLILNQYGPEKWIGSIHIEVADDLTAKAIHALSRRISGEVFTNFGVVLTIGIYAANTGTGEYAAIKRRILELIAGYPGILQLHGYYVDSEAHLISFDLVFDFAEKDPAAIRAAILARLTAEYPAWRFAIVQDQDFSD